MLTGLGRTLTWDGENRPLTATKAGSVTTWRYAADGTRLTRTVPGKTTLTLGDVEIRDWLGPAEHRSRHPHPDIRRDDRLSGSVRAPARRPPAP